MATKDLYVCEKVYSTCFKSSPMIFMGLMIISKRTLQIGVSLSETEAVRNFNANQLNSPLVVCQDLFFFAMYKQVTLSFAVRSAKRLNEFAGSLF